ncbi:MAG TPA: hypothetical protein ENN80_06770, partial [Candidatus Hydrogenedentes bacterium]|nr:hypothetical protein [Candidatus Hydrogenedentota bacterium]
MKRSYASLLLCTMVLLASCGKSAPLPAFDVPEERVEGADATVLPERIIVIGPHLTECVFALGAGGRVVGVDTFSDYPPATRDLPKVGAYIDADLETITILEPDLLIVAGKPGHIMEFAALRSIPVLSIHMDSLATINEGLVQLGEALGCPEHGEALRAEIQSELNAVRELIAGQLRPKVLIVTGRPQHNLNTIFTVGGKSFVSELIQAAGGDNIYQDAPEAYFEASKEDLVIKAPEVIVEFHAGEQLSEKKQARFIADWDRLPSLPAVQNKRIHLVTESHTLRPGPRVKELVWHFTRLLHP